MIPERVCTHPAGLGLSSASNEGPTYRTRPNVSGMPGFEGGGSVEQERQSFDEDPAEAFLAGFVPSGVELVVRAAHVVSEEVEDLGDHRAGGGAEGNSVSL